MEKERWNDKQKIAFVKIQNEILSKMKLKNIEVAEMFTLEDKERVFTLFQFQTQRWIYQLKIKPYYDEEGY